MQRTRVFNARALDKVDLIYLDRKDYMQFCSIANFRKMIDQVSLYNNMEKEGN